MSDSLQPAGMRALTAEREGRRTAERDLKRITAEAQMLRDAIQRRGTTPSPTIVDHAVEARLAPVRAAEQISAATILSNLTVINQKLDLMLDLLGMEK
jgi:hypothetical protein